MNFSNIFSNMKNKNILDNQINRWIKCPKCLALMFHKEIELKHNVCPKCNHHFRINVNQRIKLIADEDSFIESDASLSPLDPLEFTDLKSYKKRLEEAKSKTGKFSSVVAGSCTIYNMLVELVIFDFSFMGGSLGSVEGEKIVRAVNRALQKKCGLIIVSASGGTVYVSE